MFSSLKGNEKDGNKMGIYNVPLIDYITNKYEQNLEKHAYKAIGYLSIW